jgi:hypothetical protein
MSINLAPKALGHSSFAQWWMNILYCPFLIFFYREVITSQLLRVVLFPFNIWLLEIVQGYFLQYLFGTNPAWEYRGWDALFHNNIKLQYYPIWFPLGIVIEVLFNYDIVDMLAAEAFPYVEQVLTFAIAATLCFSPCMSIFALIESLKEKDQSIFLFPSAQVMNNNSSSSESSEEEEDEVVAPKRKAKTPTKKTPTKARATSKSPARSRAASKAATPKSRSKSPAAPRAKKGPAVNVKDTKSPSVVRATKKETKARATTPSKARATTPSKARARSPVRTRNTPGKPKKN